MNIGIRPTFESGEELVLEVHLLDFTEDIYDINLRVGFLGRIRDEVRFNSKMELVDQIQQDKEETLEIIKTLIN